MRFAHCRPGQPRRHAAAVSSPRTLGIEDQTLSRINCRQSQMQASCAHRRFAPLPSCQNGSSSRPHWIGLLRIANEASERFNNEGNFCSARVRRAGTRGTGRGDSSRTESKRASDKSIEEELRRQLARAAVAFRLACRFNATQTLGEFRQPIVNQNPMPNPLVELTRYGVAPRLPRACASRIVALVSQGATPQRSAHRER